MSSSVLSSWAMKTLWAALFSLAWAQKASRSGSQGRVTILKVRLPGVRSVKLGSARSSRTISSPRTRTRNSGTALRALVQSQTIVM